MDLTDLLKNKIEFGVQAHQQTTTVDTWAYWEYETYVEILTDKNQKAGNNKESTEGANNPMKSFNVDSAIRKMKTSMPKFK